MNLANRLENEIPIRAAKVCRRAEAGDGVLLGVGIIDHDVGCVVGFDFCGEVLRT